jgi:hypothetical protein
VVPREALHPRSRKDRMKTTATSFAVDAKRGETLEVTLKAK